MHACARARALVCVCLCVCTRERISVACIARWPRAFRTSLILCHLVQDMTYTKQLDAYENAVMKKRLEEMPESERDRLYAEIESEREAKKQRQQQ